MRPIAVLFLAAALCSAHDDSVFRIDVALVHLDSEVVAQDGRIVTGLGRDDFRVFDQGREQPILNFAAGEQPLDLILLFDISTSMRPVVERVAASAGQAFRELRPGDRVSVMVFNTRSKVITPFTGKLDDVDRALREDVLGHEFRGGTYIQTAVDDAALRFLREERTQRRRAVLIVTDNIGQRTRREDTVVRNFWEADAILSGLIVPNPGYQVRRAISIVLGPQNLLMEAGMKGIAEKTGGDAISADDPESAFQQAIHRIRSRYSLYYALPEAKPGARRTVRVELAAAAAQQFPKSRIRTRTGYLAPKTRPYR